MNDLIAITNIFFGTLSGFLMLIAARAEKYGKIVYVVISLTCFYMAGIYIALLMGWLSIGLLSATLARPAVAILLAAPAILYFLRRGDEH